MLPFLYFLIHLFQEFGDTFFEGRGWVELCFLPQVDEVLLCHEVGLSSYRDLASDFENITEFYLAVDDRVPIAALCRFCCQFSIVN